MTLGEALAALPLIAILRGVTPDESIEIGRVLIRAEWRAIEVPLNSPAPFDSIRRLSREFGGAASIGAGTVLASEDVDRVADAGGKLIVAPNGNEAVVKRARALGLSSLPGFYTPTEAFRMIAAGADALKFFPADAAPPAMLKAMTAVLPAGVPLVPTGGIDAGNLKAWREAGATGFGIGGALYKPGIALDELRLRAERLVQAARSP
jgi:2-dehydro-3-deoxyphosphogalactonate aldolase